MNVYTVKKPQKRSVSPYLSEFNIKGYGADNLYPQRLREIVQASPTARGCLTRYARFVGGMGFKQGGDLVINRNGETLDGLLHLVSEDYAMFNGFAIHVNYNALGEVVEMQHVPFEMCRLEEPDDRGYISAVAVHPDWAGLSTRNGKRIKVTKASVTKYPIFNPMPEIIQAQINAVGGVAYYSGQILWVSGDGGLTYPLPKYDSAISEMSTDEGLANVMARNVRNNFLSAGIMFVRTSQSAPNAPTTALGSDEFTEAIQALQGDERALSLLQVTLEPGEERPELVNFPTKNFDKDFTATAESITERIYSAFEQEPFLSIRNGKLGFSGTVIHDAYSYYSNIVSTEQRVISRALDHILSVWTSPIAFNLEVEPLKFTEV